MSRAVKNTSKASRPTPKFLVTLYQKGLSLRFIILIPFILEIIAVFSIVSWLSFQNGQSAVNDVAHQLCQEITAKIQERVQTYLNVPHLVNRLNANAIELGDVDLTQSDKRERYLWKQIKTFPSINNTYITNHQGTFYGAKRLINGSLQLSLKAAHSRDIDYFTVNEQGQRQHLVATIPNYNPQQRPWYLKAKTVGKPTWSSIYLDFGSQSLAITAAEPVYDAGQLQYVLGCDVFFGQLDAFLAHLQIGKHGQTFIVETSGLLVSTSNQASLFNVSSTGEKNRLLASASTDPLIQHSSQYLLDRFGDFSAIHHSHALDFELNGARYFLQVAPLKDERGLNWLSVVVIPEADFMEHIYSSTRSTILLSFLALGIALLIGVLIARSIIKPILELNKATSKLAEGEWAQKLPTERKDELGQLARSFDCMSEELKESFHQLELWNANLERKVAERTTQLQKSNALIRQVFGRYLSDEIVATLLDTDSGLSLGGERREITILTSDLRGFTQQSTYLSPEQVIDVINCYLAAMAEVITGYNGTIDEFMGDGVLVLFGAPIVRQDDPERAIACAVAMQLAMSKVNEEMRRRKLAPLEMGIGINTGEVVVGNIGSEKRTKYGVIGAEVNLAYRIESYTTGGQIFISESTFKRCQNSVKVRSQQQVRPKGVAKPITIYEVDGIGGQYNLFFHREEEVLLPLVNAIHITYSIIAGKHLNEGVFQGEIVKLSARSALIDCDKHAVAELMDNLKINLIIPNCEHSEDIYAKVINKEKNTSNVYIHFTSTLSQALEIQLTTLFTFKWTPDIAIHNEIIDAEHHQIFDKLNDLITSIGQRNPEAIKQIVYFLEDYVVFHFKHEEELMVHYNYPGYAHHKKQHHAFIDKIHKLKQMLFESCTTASLETGEYLKLALHIQQELGYWLVHHIGNYDKQIGTFIDKQHTSDSP